MKTQLNCYENIWGKITTRNQKQYVITQDIRHSTYCLYVRKNNSQYFQIAEANDPIKLISKIEQQRGDDFE